MTYGLWLQMDQSQWYRDDFSDTNLLTGTLYSNKQMTVKAVLTGYTLTIRLAKGNRWGDHFNRTATIVSATGGTFSYAVAEGQMPPPGIYNVKLELTKSGSRESTLNRQELFILEGPTT